MPLEKRMAVSSDCQYYPQLNGLRALFCIGICFFIHYHWLLTDGYGMRFPLGGYTRWLYQYGYYGVEFFFVLSGFVSENTFTVHKVHKNVFAYTWAKLRRHYSLLIITLFTTTILQFVYRSLTGIWFYVGSVDAQTILMSMCNISSGWFLVDNNLNMPCWYFSVLMLLWIVFYALKRMDKGDNCRFQFGSFLMIVLGLSILIADKPSGPFLFEGTARGYYCFFVGCLLCDFYQHFKGNRSLCTFWAWLLLFAMMGMLFMSYIWGGRVVLGNPQIIFGAFFCPSLIWCALNLNFIKTILEFRPLQYIGDISSHIYFWHFACYQLVRIISEIIPIRPFFDRVWFYFVTILFLFFVSSVSAALMRRDAPLFRGIVR